MAVELKGSPKQIAWAKSIRADRMNTWKKADPVVFQHLHSSLENESSASWWITHREKELNDVLPFITVGGDKKATVKAAVVPKTGAAAPKETINSFEGITYRLVGDLRSVATGEVVIGPECPF